MDKAIKSLMFDLAADREVFDAENNRALSKEEANDVLRNACFDLTGLNEKSSLRDIRRAFSKDSGKEFFEVIEEILDVYTPGGWKDNEFFDQFVETRNMKDGDLNEFWAKEDIILNVAKVAGDHHDLIMQKLNEGESYSVPTSVYAVKVGTDIRMFLTGRKDWAEFIEAVSKAMNKAVRDEIYTEFMNAADKMASVSGFSGTGALSSSVKEDFDEIIENVAGINESEVVIMGTKTALKQLGKLTLVDWRSNSQKEAVAETGILGSYEGATLIEIPQRFENNDVASALVDSTLLFIMPVVDYKPVKFVDYGETSLEVTEVGDTMNDQQSFEVQRRMGAASIITRKFGVWDLDA